VEYLFYALLLALLIGVVAGLRSLTAPAMVAWGAYLGWINLQGHWVAWVGSLVAVIVLSLLAVGELVTDKLPKTPPRTAPPSFGARLFMGGFSGYVVGVPFGHPWAALGAGVVGAVLGTLGGYRVRGLLAARAGKDLPVALFEDAVAIFGGLGIAALVMSL
jgi:uncharacterized membrane protein